MILRNPDNYLLTYKRNGESGPGVSLLLIPEEDCGHDKVRIFKGPFRFCGTAVAQWLRCCATNRKFAGSIPDGVTGIFHWHNLSDRTMALGSTQPLTEMSTRSISWG